MGTRLSLRTKGLLVVCAILVMECILVGRLVFLLRVAEDQLTREQHTQNVIYHLNRQANQMQRLTIEFIRFVVTKEQEETARQVEISKAQSREFEKLEELLKDDPQQLQKVLDLKKTLETSNSLMAVCRQAYFEGNQTQHWQLAAKLHTISDRCTRKCDRILDDFIERARDDRENLLRLRGDVENWLIVVSVANLVLCVSLVVWFSSAVTHPLATIVDNMRRLADGRALNKGLSSTDELGSLDRTFHNMADEIEAAKQRKKELVAMVSHDLRAPLSTVNGALALIEKEGFDPSSQEGARTIKVAKDSVSRLLDLVNDLLDIEKLETGTLDMDLDCVDLGYIVEKSIDSVFGLCQSKNVTVSHSSTTLQVIADTSRAIQVMTNLLSNAVKHSPSGGEVRVEVGKILTTKMAEIKIVDRGEGISQESFGAIFKPFHQLSASDGHRGQGTGLGLAISKAIIEAHGGTIGVVSEVGKGSTFWIMIPLADPD